MTFYFCDLQDHCCGSPNCSRNGGPCKHTTKPDHAINGECKMPIKEPARFEAETFNTGFSEVTYFWERDPKEKKEEVIDEEDFEEEV